MEIKTVLIIFGFIIVAIFILYIVFCLKFCDGGGLIKGCGKPLFPWTEKFRISDDYYCCKVCFYRDLKMFRDFNDVPKRNIRFTEQEEELNGEADS